MSTVGRIGSAVATTVGGKSAPIINTYTGRRAEQDVSGMTSIVRSRSRKRGMERVARMAGTAHA